MSTVLNDLAVLKVGKRSDAYSVCYRYYCFPLGHRDIFFNNLDFGDRVKIACGLIEHNKVLAAILRPRNGYLLPLTSGKLGSAYIFSKESVLFRSPNTRKSESFVDLRLVTLSFRLSKKYIVGNGKGC
jgi:hypothetical protein